MGITVQRPQDIYYILHDMSINKLTHTFTRVTQALVSVWKVWVNVLMDTSYKIYNLQVVSRLKDYRYKSICGLEGHNMGKPQKNKTV